MRVSKAIKALISCERAFPLLWDSYSKVSDSSSHMAAIALPFNLYLCFLLENFSVSVLPCKMIYVVARRPTHPPKQQKGPGIFKHPYILDPTTWFLYTSRLIINEQDETTRSGYYVFENPKK